MQTLKILIVGCTNLPLVTDKLTDVDTKITVQLKLCYWLNILYVKNILKNIILKAGWQKWPEIENQVVADHLGRL